MLRTALVHALFRMLRKLTVSYGPTEMLYIGASPGGLPASEASPSRHAEPPPASPPLSPYLRAARIGRGPVRYTPPPSPPPPSPPRGDLGGGRPWASWGKKKKKKIKNNLRA